MVPAITVPPRAAAGLRVAPASPIMRAAVATPVVAIRAAAVPAASVATLAVVAVPTAPAAAVTAI